MPSPRKLGKLGDLAGDAADVARRAARMDHVLIGAPFEEVYPRYEFSELVRLGLALGSWIGRRRRLFAAKPDLPPALPPSPTATAD